MASMLVGPRQVATVSLPEPRAGAGDVVVRVEGCGVCASSLPVWEGRPWFTYPQPAGAPGHEAWGRVHEVGEDVTELEPGARVAMLSFNGFAELETVPAAACVALPAELDPLPFPGEALGCAVNVVRRARIVPGDDVAIVGMGFLGTAVAAAVPARRLGRRRRSGGAARRSAGSAA